MADLKRIIFDFISAINYSFLLFLHNTSIKKCSIKIKKLPIILQLNFFANAPLKKCRNYEFCCFGNVTLVICGLNFSLTECQIKTI